MRIAILGLCVLAASARADEWVTPTARTLTSPNKKLQATVTPSADGKSAAHVAIGGQSYALASRWMPVDTVLFDDGSLLALDDWHQLGYGKVATVYERDGSVRWTKTLAELLGQTFVDGAPHSVSSIWWRKTPIEWTLGKGGKTGLVTLYDENKLELDLKTGAAKVVSVGNLGDDPQRLLNRARALTSSNQDAQALPLLERILTKDADQLEAALLYVETLQKANDHARAVAALDKLAPRWKTKDGYGLANVYVAWGKSLVVLGKPADAERVLRLGIAATPGYTNPTIALAKLLVDQKRPKDADVVLDDFVARLLKAPSLDDYALAEVADFYKTRGDLQKALVHYLKGYKPDRVTNQFLYAQLASLYEQMGKIADAIRIDEQLLSYFEKMGPAFGTYATSTRTDLNRLRSLPRR